MIVDFKFLLSFCFLLSGGPTVAIKSRSPPSGTRTPPRVTRTENKSDDKLFEFLNSNIPAAKERKPVKPKASVESSSEVVVKPSDTVELTQDDSTDGQLNEGWGELIFAAFYMYISLHVQLKLSLQTPLYYGNSLGPEDIQIHTISTSVTWTPL